MFEFSRLAVTEIKSPAVSSDPQSARFIFKKAKTLLLLRLNELEVSFLKVVNFSFFKSSLLNPWAPIQRMPDLSSYNELIESSPKLFESFGS